MSSLAKELRDAADAVDELEANLAVLKRQAQRIVELDDKWRDYENNYILPVFKWAKEMEIDLRALVAAGGGNCVELFFRELRKQIVELQTQLSIERMRP